MQFSLKIAASHSNQPRLPRRHLANVGLTVVALVLGGCPLGPLPFPMLLAAGPVVPVALPHQGHLHAHVQGPVACRKAALASLLAAR